MFAYLRLSGFFSSLSRMLPFDDLGELWRRLCERFWPVDVLSRPAAGELASFPSRSLPLSVVGSTSRSLASSVYSASLPGDEARKSLIFSRSSPLVVIRCCSGGESQSVSGQPRFGRT